MTDRVHGKPCAIAFPFPSMPLPPGSLSYFACFQYRQCSLLWRPENPVSDDALVVLTARRNSSRHWPSSPLWWEYTAGATGGGRLHARLELISMILTIRPHNLQDHQCEV